MGAEILLTANNLTRSYHGIRVINDVNLTLHRGEVLGLLGPNGAGKSTTLKILSGVLNANSGTVTICGKPLDSKSTSVRRHVGYLPEEAPLYLDQTVEEYLIYCARLRGLGEAKVLEAVAKAKAACDLNDVNTRLIANLSKGYKQRIGIAQAIVHEPEVLILDEPTNGLDPNQIRDVRQLIKTLARTQALILSTHVLSEVQSLCDRVVILHRGEIAYDKTSDRIAHALEIELSKKPNETFFGQLDAVESYHALSETRYVIKVTDRILSAKSIARATTAQDLTLLEMSPATSQLEQLFFEITCNDALHFDD